MHLRSPLPDLVNQQNVRIFEIQEGARRHLEKSKKCYRRNRLTDFDEIWHGDVSLPPEPLSNKIC